MEHRESNVKKRYSILDGIRGAAVISMILYHGMWDIVYIFGHQIQWYGSIYGYIWQQSICWVFILLSGFCWSFGSRNLKRGFIVFAAGMIITAVTLLFMPENRVVFGVLTLLGSSMLLLDGIEKYLKKCNETVGFVISIGLFVLMRDVNRGFLGFEHWHIWRIPDFLYRNLITTFLGFPSDNFYSTDYFSIFPWFFLFLTGYFTCRIVRKYYGTEWLEKERVKGVEWIGRHSLEIYMLHQPVLYAGFTIIMSVIAQ